MGRAALLVVSMLSALPVEAGAPRGASRKDDRRYVSAQAYLHAMQAEVLAAEGKEDAALESLELALVYDPDSPHLNLAVARASWKLGRTQKIDRLVERAVAAAPNRAGPLLLRAEIERSKQRSDLAERSLARAAEVEPDSPEGIAAAIQLAEAFGARGREQDAIAVLERASRRAPQSAAPLTALSRLAASFGKADVAVSSLEDAVDRAPDDAELVVELAALDDRVGRLEDAAKAWRRRLEVGGPDPEALLGAARAELRAGHEARALACARALAARDRDGALRVRAGIVFLEERLPGPARSMLSEALVLRPEDDRARIAYARALAASGETGPAIAALEAVRAGGDAYLEARQLLASLLSEVSGVDKAVRALKVGLKERPDALPLVLALADLLDRAGQHAAALAEIDAFLATRSTPPPIDLVAAEARLIAARGDLGRAVQLLDGAARANARSRRDAWSRLAALHAAYGSGAEAERLLRALLVDAPDDVEALTSLAGMLLDRGARGKEAGMLAARAVAADPDSAAAQAVLGRALLAEGRNGAAVRALARAARLDPDSAEIAEHRGDALLAIREERFARAEYERSARLLQRLVRQNAPGAESALARIRDKRAQITSLRP